MTARHYTLGLVRDGDASLTNPDGDLNDTGAPKKHTPSPAETAGEGVKTPNAVR